jgi:hypothetical protein
MIIAGWRKQAVLQLLSQHSGQALTAQARRDFMTIFASSQMWSRNELHNME